MTDAWIGVFGALIGALAGISGAWLTHVLTSRGARRKEIQDAAADLIAKASLPSVVHRALEARAIGREQVSALILPWSEDTMRCRAKLAALAPGVFGLCDFLWQRSWDHMDALLRGDAQTAESLGNEVVEITVRLEQTLAMELSHERIQRALD